MIEVFDRITRRRTAILENAHDISENRRINAVNYLYFSLPDNDPKNHFCQPFHYVRMNGGELHRIMPSTLDSGETGTTAYQCEHVLATLIDNILFGYHVVGNLGTYTADVIQYVLDHQLVKNWVLYECDYRNQFEYGWEQESLLSALFSIPKPLTGRYIWRTDTSVYPWRLSLKRLDVTGKPEMYIRRMHNMVNLQRDSDPQQIVTRLYPLGYGEGVNQLGIASVNNGVPYLQSPKAITDKYGIIERAWIDRRYEDPSSLKAAAQAMLDELQEPLVSYEVGYQELGQSDFDRAEIGKRVRIVDQEAGLSVDTFITEINRDYNDVENSTVVVANRETSIASTLADMANRQRIEEAYAQGATQIYSQALQANCDKTSGAVMDFFIPEEMRIINKVLVKVRMAPFRAYSKSTATADSQVITSTTSDNNTWTSSGGGGTTSTTTSTEDQTRTSSAGGGESATSDAGGDVSLTAQGGVNVEYRVASTMPQNGVTTGLSPAAEKGHFHNFLEVSSHAHIVGIPAHSHRFTVQPHSHSISIPGHYHRITLSDHTHSLTIPGHSHNVTIPSHAHSITPGIYRYGNPTKFDLYVNGTKKADFSGRTAELNITEFLVGSNNMIPRGSWLSLEVRPDDLAYISIDLIVQGFIQSRGDKTV